MNYDVFNGDADGICALLQLRLAQPLSSTLITGVKRDIHLLQQVSQQADAKQVTVLDISMEKNATALTQLLRNQATVFYCDHHRAGVIPSHPKLTTLINLDAQSCTSLLINHHLGGQFPLWAITGAYGDNLFSRADQLAETLKLNLSERKFLKELGTLVNYNSYGANLEDLLIPPAQLYQQLYYYHSPLELAAKTDSLFYQLQAGYQADMAMATTYRPIRETEKIRVIALPNAPWARRISGALGNALTNQAPNMAHAILTLNADECSYCVSVRAPLNRREGADEVCSAFETGGGRRAAAGINVLPLQQLDHFITTLQQRYW
ncbi:MAG: DHH family phosphoesterase [Ferrimonas sp.]